MLVILIIEKEIKTIPMKIATISYTSMVTRFAMSTVHNGENMMIYLMICIWSLEDVMFQELKDD